MANVKGQFIPDLLLLVSGFLSPGEMKQAFTFLDELFASGGQPKQKLSKDVITAFTVWVHEFTHFVQFTTRISAADYYSFSTSLANYTIDASLKLKNVLSAEAGAFLPIHKHIFRNYSNLDEVDSISKDWLEYYFGANQVLAVGGWSPRQNQDRLLLQTLSDNNHEMFPRLKYSNDSGENIEKQLCTETVLETEAFIVSTNVLRIYFPDSYQEILAELHPTVDEHIEFALNLISSGYEILVPVMADFAMQAASFLPSYQADTKDSFQRVSIPWRFLKAMEVCRPYCGINYQDFSKHRDEILEKLSSIYSSEQEKGTITEVLALLEKHQVSGISPSLSALLRQNIGVRLEKPSWFVSPETFLPELHAKLRLPRVKFAHRGIEEGLPYLSSMGFGENSMTPAEQGELLFDSMRRWLGRQLAKSEGEYVCPDCLLDYRQQECSGSCFYSKYVYEILGFNPSEFWISN